MVSSTGLGEMDALLRRLVSNSAQAGAEATVFILADFRAMAKTPEAVAAVREAEAAWLVFHQALAAAARVDNSPLV